MSVHIPIGAGVRSQRAEQHTDSLPTRRTSAAATSRYGPSAADGAAARRLLIPIDATERSRWALRYVLARREQPLQVELLFVAEPVTSLEVLRFRTQADIAEFQAQCAQWLLEDAAQPLQAAGLAVRRHFREGRVASQIVEAAEQLGCEAIVMPSPHPAWLNFLTRGIAREVMRRARASAFLAVDRKGNPVELARAAAAVR